MPGLRWRLSKNTTARSLAWELLRAVWRDGAYANLVWSGMLQRSGLDPANRAFATELGYGTLRHHGQLERVLVRAGGRSPQQLDPEVWWVLLLGSYQLLHLSTARHAAVNESVRLVKSIRKASASGLVNAILRRVSQKSLEEWLDELTGPLDGDAALAVRFSHPEWVVTALRQSLAREGREEEIDELLASHNTPARVTAALLPGLAEPHGDDQPTPYSPIGVYLSGDPAADARIASGTARIQDEGSQLAALIAAQALPLEQGMRVLDACSGPGGKTAVLASHTVPRGAQLEAVEIQPHRARLVEDSLRAFPEGSAISIHTADVGAFLDSASGFDVILLDAPCLGLGALRRRPEARWTKKLEDLEGLRSVQTSLLDQCVGALNPGGVLVYVTCSPVVEETTDQIAAALNRHPEVEAVPTEPLLQSVSSRPIPAAGVGTAVQLWPHRHGTDAMFIQVLECRR